jgi:hypothetical protein
MMSDIEGMLANPQVDARETSFYSTDRKWMYLDAFRSLDAFTFESRRTKRTSFTTKLWDMFETPSLLVLIGVSSAVLRYMMIQVLNVGDDFTYSLMGTATDPLCWTMYISCCIVMAIAANMVTQKICPDSVGGDHHEL